MANEFLTIGMIAYLCLPVLHNNTIAARKVTRKYEDQFARKGAKIGQVFSVRKPPRYTVTESLTFQPQDYTDEQVQLTVDKHLQVGVEFNDDDLTMSFDDFQGRVLAPALVPLANKVDTTILALYKQVWNATGVPGSLAATDQPYVDANTLLWNNAAAASNDWPMLVNPRTGGRLSTGLAGRFNPQPAISKLYEEGRMNNSYKSMGMALGWDFYESQNMPTHTTGAWSAAVAGTGIQVDGADQVGSSILLKGASNTITNMAKEGDVVQFNGVNAVNPITKEDIGEMQEFVVTADASSTGGGALTLVLDPPIVLTGKNQTVTASPADSAQVYVWGTATVANVANKVSPQGLGWSEDAVTLACVDLQTFPEGTGVKSVRASDPDVGLSIMFSQFSDGRTFSVGNRFDILFGTVLTRKEHMVRVASGSQ